MNCVNYVGYFKIHSPDTHLNHCRNDFSEEKQEFHGRLDGTVTSKSALQPYLCHFPQSRKHTGGRESFRKEGKDSGQVYPPMAAPKATRAGMPDKDDGFMESRLCRLEIL